jgi:uncharacterized protein YcbX
MTITQLFVFPIKSLAGIAVNSSELTPKGLKYDRRWLLLDKNGVHVTQRTHPILVLFKTTLLDNGIGVHYKNEEIFIPFNLGKRKKDPINANVWDDQFKTYEVSKEISKWFTLKLDKEVRLVYQPDDSFRQADQTYANSPSDDVSAADGFPILIISDESLAELNSRLDEPVDMLRFRPNIVVNGLKAFGEDELGLITSGQFSLLGVKNCGRCIMVTNDLNDGKLGKEPLNTLSRFRASGNKVLFGRNFIPRRLGLVKIGDELIAE